jgi:hypothetical protein
LNKSGGFRQAQEILQSSETDFDIKLKEKFSFDVELAVK